MELTRLVADMRSLGGELPGIEVKSAAVGLPESITETMSAFANLPAIHIAIDVESSKRQTLS